MTFLVFQHIKCEGLGILEEILNSHGHTHDTVELFNDAEIPATIGNYAGLIILGGPMSVNDVARLSYLPAELEFVKNAIDLEIPVIGICLGSQLIAKALGSEVFVGDQKEIGWAKISLTSEGIKDHFFGSLPENLTVFHWHGETFHLPENATLLASSELFPNQAFRFGKSTYAIQFHLEVTRKMISEWLKEYQSELEISPAQILEETNLQIDKLNHYARSVFGRIFNECL